MGKPIVYLYFHSVILKWKGKEMSEKEFRSCFFQWRIPKTLRYLIMEEMQKMGLIKLRKGKGQRIVEINNYYFDDSIKTKTKDKDGDTKIKSPYISLKNE